MQTAHLRRPFELRLSFISILLLSSSSSPKLSRMLRLQNSVSRIPRLARPLRPPSCRASPYQLRPFTNNHLRLLISPSPGRPQLPFLSPVSGNRPLPPLSIHLRQHFARLVSTESRNYYKRRISRGLRIGLTFYAILVLFQVIKLGVYQEDIEHKWPTPPEWTWKSKWCLRSAEALQHPEEIGKLMANWPMVDGYMRELIKRLEDPNGEGKGIMKRSDGGTLPFEGVGNGETGFDVSEKSEPWRRGYFQALMNAAKAAENLDGWVTDQKSLISAPSEYMVGPSNPRPKPMPPKQKKVPHEENCEPAAQSPETYYVKILTTTGFNTRQKVDAALAYGSWLDYKGLQEAASNMYRRAIDIATSGLSGDAAKVIDLKTGILKNNGKDFPSENVLRASTALAVHHASQGCLPIALSIFTSVLKARRNLPQPPPDAIPPPSPPVPKPPKNPFSALIHSIKTVLIPVTYPPALPSGNEPPLRTPSSICDESGLMAYIGEIIYASSSKETGLAWTRDAVDMAESTLLDLPDSSRDISHQKCSECLKVGLGNWKTMLSRLVAVSEREELESMEKAKSSWLSFGGSKTVRAKSLERKRWEAERAILNDRTRRLWPTIEGESGLDGLAPHSSLFV